jgi:hypothetical protein
MMYHMDPLPSEISNKNLKIQTFHEDNFDNNIYVFQENRNFIDKNWTSVSSTKSVNQ